MKPSFHIQENAPLAPLTTLQIGGNARYFVHAETESQVVEAVDLAKSNGLKTFILGGGSNVLIADKGFDGLVVKIALLGVESTEWRVERGNVRIDSDSQLSTLNSKLITVGAGEDWDGFVACCVENQLAGVECLSGIPGFVGGTPVQNVGAYGQEVAETIVEVRCFDRKTGAIVTLSNEECGFAYRTSIFNSTHRERYIVLSVTFSLRPNGDPKLVYKDLIEYFSDRQPSLAEVREAVLSIRRAKSMVIDAADPNSRSAGSFFKNPIVTREKLDEVRNSFERVPHFKFGEMFKIPAAWLIENSGFQKGFTMGRAGISSKHTLALINRGDAAASEIIDLKDRIQKTVAAEFGIELFPEPVFVGF